MAIRLKLSTGLKVIVSTIVAAVMWNWWPLANILWMNAVAFSQLLNHRSASFTFAVLEVMIVVLIIWEVMEKASQLARIIISRYMR